MRGRQLAAYLTCCAAWGSTWIVIRFGLADLPPFLFAGTRMLLASALLLPLAIRARLHRLPRRDWPHVAMIGALNMALSYGLMFAAQRHIPSGLAALLFATFPIWCGLYAHWLLPEEPLTPVRVAAALLGLVGVGVLEVPALLGVSFASDFWFPILLGLTAPFVAGFTNVWMKRRLSSVAPAVNLWGQTLVGGALLLGLSLAVEGDQPARWTASALGAVAYLAIVGTVLTFLLLFWLLPRIPMSAVAAIPLLDTLIALTLGTLIGKEPLTWSLAAGAALILAGAALANRVGKAAPAVDPDVPAPTTGG